MSEVLYNMHLLIVGLTMAQGKSFEHFKTSCSAKCFVNVYVLGWSLSSLENDIGVINNNFTNISSLRDLVNVGWNWH